MKPAPFEYRDPASLEEALTILSAHGDEAKILAGGQSLVPLLNMRLAQPRVLVDINRIDELQCVAPQSRNGEPGLSVGSVTRQSVVEGEPRIPLLRQAIAQVGHPQIRNRGTVGGSIAHADPASELPLVLLALDGVVTARSSRGTRQIAARDFFRFTFTTALEPDEVLTEIWLPLPDSRTRQAFLEVARRHGDFALIAVAVSVDKDEDGRIGDARIAIGGAAPTPIRAESAEDVLRGEHPTGALIDEAGALAVAETDPAGDIHADAEYRREVTGVLVRRALRQALEIA